MTDKILMEDVDHCLNKAVEAEEQWVKAGKPAAIPGEKASPRNKANIYFRKAMQNDGTPMTGDVI